jgi:primary-amine oxidase
MRLAHRLMIFVLTGGFAASFSATAAADCFGPYDEQPVASFTRTFTSGAAWSFDVVRQNCEGMVLERLTYKPAGGAATLVLARGSLDAIHVPYLENANRFEDVLDNLGGGLGDRAHVLAPEECPGTAPGGGSPLFSDNQICVHNADGGIRWKNGANARRAERIQLFMATEANGYNYINLWELNDDGSIGVRTGLTGKLVLTTDKLSYLPGFGSRTDPENNSPPEIGIAHQHNIYYRLDFDIGGSAGDRVLRKTFTPSTSASPDSSCSTTGQCGKITYTTISTEAKETWSSNNFTTWVVTDKNLKNADGRNLGYELVPRISGIWRGMTGTTEPWAGHEAYVTLFHLCERFPIGNNSDFVGALCDGVVAPTDITKMVNGETVDNADLVVWYANRFLHYPRDEDDERMPIEWMSFDIVPRSFYFQNPSP